MQTPSKQIRISGRTGTLPLTSFKKPNTEIDHRITEISQPLTPQRHNSNQLFSQNMSLVVQKPTSRFSGVQQRNPTRPREEQDDSQIECLKNKLLKTCDTLRLKNIKYNQTTAKLSDAQKQIEQMKGLVVRNQNLRHTNQNLERKVAKLQSSLQENLKQIKQRKEQISHLKGMLGMLKDRVNKENAHKDTLTEKNKEVADLQEMCRIFNKKYQEEYSITTSKIVQTQIHLDEIEQLNTVIQCLKKELTESNVEKMKLARNYAELEFSSKQYVDMEKTIFKHQAEIVQLKSRLSTDSKSKSQLVSQFQTQKLELEQKLQLLKQHNLLLKGQERRASDSIEEFQTLIEFLKTKVERAEYIFCQVLELLKCIDCKKVCKQSVTLIPCGHSFCSGCDKSSLLKFCPRCGPTSHIEKYHRNFVLDAMTCLLENHGEMVDKIQIF